jgi:GTP-binding protein
MKITSAEFVKSAFSEEHWTTDKKPEIAFMGKSNVGKSSLINSLLNRKNLARTSKTPGRTQSLNFFLINEKFYFVDLPGYGFAKVPAKMQKEWGKMIEDYLAKRTQLMLFIQLVDSRHAPSALDKQLHEWLLFYRKPHLVVATKADKLSKTKLNESLEAIRNELSESEVLSYSAKDDSGKAELWAKISEAVKIK